MPALALRAVARATQVGGEDGGARRGGVCRRSAAYGGEGSRRSVVKRRAGGGVGRARTLSEARARLRVEVARGRSWMQPKTWTPST